MLFYISIGCLKELTRLQTTFCSLVHVTVANIAKYRQICHVTKALRTEMHFCVYSLILPFCPFNKYLLSTYYVLSPALIPEDAKATFLQDIFVCFFFFSPGTRIRITSFNGMNFKSIAHSSKFLHLVRKASNSHSEDSQLTPPAYLACQAGFPAFAFSSLAHQP